MGQATPITEGDVKPINPVIHRPIPQYTPNPQTDQSHPIPQGIDVIKAPRIPQHEIITDIKLPIQSKKTQQKLIKKEIKPQMPPEPTPLHDKYTLPPGTFPLKIQKKK